MKTVNCFPLLILFFLLFSTGTTTTMIGTTKTAQACGRFSNYYMKNCKQFTCKQQCRSIGVCQGCGCSTVEADTCCCEFPN